MGTYRKVSISFATGNFNFDLNLIDQTVFLAGTARARGSGTGCILR